MTKEDLLKLWAKHVEEDQMELMTALRTIYDVGFEAGKDAQKLERQLEMTPPWTDGD